MKKKNCIYRVFKHHANKGGYSAYGRYHQLIIMVDKVQDFDRDDIEFTWQANADENEKGEWYGLNIHYRAKNFDMLPLMQKMAKERYSWGHSPAEIVTFLVNNGVEPGTFVETRSEEGKITHAGFAKLTGIQLNKIVRYGKTHTLTAHQRTELIGKIVDMENFDMPADKQVEQFS